MDCVITARDLSNHKNFLTNSKGSVAEPTQPIQLTQLHVSGRLKSRKIG
jgi:hypothetical protein